MQSLHIFPRLTFAVARFPALHAIGFIFPVHKAPVYRASPCFDNFVIVFLILDFWPFYCSLNRNCSMMKSRNHLWWADTSFFKSIRYEYDIYDIWHFTIPIYPVLMISGIWYRNHLSFLCQFGCLSTCLCSLCIEDCQSCKQNINFASSCI